MIAAIKPVSSPSTETLHRQFVDSILPAVDRHAGIQFRHVRGQDRDDAVQETKAVAWQLFVLATESGKDPTSFPTYIAAFAVRRVRSGRLLAGPSTRDVLSPTTQLRHGFEVESLDDESCDPSTGWKAAVTQDSRHSTPADTVAFRLDFERWLNTLPGRDRAIGERLAVGDRPGQVAVKFRLSPSMITLVRRKLQASWTKFQDAVPAGLLAAGVPR